MNVLAENEEDLKSHGRNLERLTISWNEADQVRNYGTMEGKDLYKRYQLVGIKFQTC